MLSKKCNFFHKTKQLKVSFNLFNQVVIREEPDFICKQEHLFPLRSAKHVLVKD